MYKELIRTPDQALVHLAVHCCLKDGDLQSEELDFMATTFVAKGLNKNLNLKEEMAHYQSYRPVIKDETAYLDFLLDTIQPFHKLALFAFCAEIIYRNGRVSFSEEVLLGRMASLLYVTEEQSNVIQQLITELNEVEQRNAF